MKPPRFSYLAPETVQEVVAALAEHGPEAKILAGGQSLIPLLSFRLARPTALVDVNRVTGLDYLRWDDGEVRIGALTRHRAVEQDAETSRRCAMVLEALSVVGHVAIRNRGTVGGSMAHADPAAEWPALAVALGAELTITGPSGSRRLTAEDFFLGFMTTALAPDEMLTEIRLPLPPPGAGTAFVEFARRHGDYAQAGACAALQLGSSGVEGAQIGLLGVGMTPLRAVSAEQALVGEAPGPEVFARAAQLAAETMEPLDDVHADADYKRHLGTVMVERALAKAHQRAREAS